MYKSKLIISAATVIFITFYSQSLLATEKTLVVLTEHTIRIPAEGSLDEAMRLSYEWRDKVLMKMPQISRISYLLRKSEENVHKLMVIYEYAPLPEGAKALEINDAISMGFPEEQSRQAFFTQLGRYINRSENVSYQYNLLD